MKRRWTIIIAIMLILSSCFSIFLKTDEASASTSTICGDRTGYFAGLTYTDGSGGHRLFDDGLEVSNSTDFINTLVSRLDGSDDKNRIGASFIINTMLGHGCGSSKDISSTDLKSWKEAVKYYATGNKSGRRIVWNYQYGFSINTLFFNRTKDAYPKSGSADGAGDVYQYLESDTQPSIVFFGDDGKVDYAIKRACGNPVGTLYPLKTCTDDCNPGEYNNSAHTSIFVTPNEIDPGGSLTVAPSISISGTLDPKDTDIGWIVVGNSGVVQSGDWPSRPTSFTLQGQDTNYPVGTNICYTVSFRGESATDCSQVIKKPKVQILGGDLVSFGKNSTLQSPSNGKLFGSWVEYGIFASKGITGLASGAALSGGTNESTLCQYSTLSFSNDKCGTGSVGYFSNMPSVPDVAASFPVNQSSKKVGQSFNLDGLQGVYTSSSTNLNISGSSMNRGQWVVINVPNATVTISGDINSYSGGLASINDLSQLIIIAKDIIINNNVTNVDSWLIAKDGSIQTCSEQAYDSNTCNQQLRVNGPVITSHLYLYRTGGSDDMNSLDVPAEVFNLPASSYLWSYSRASSDRFMQTVYTIELPARF